MTRKNLTFLAEEAALDDAVLPPKAALRRLQFQIAAVNTERQSINPKDRGYASDKR